MKDLKRQVAKTILYFDLFSFPLKIEEIHRYCCVKVTLGDLKKVLQEMVSHGELFHLEGHYAVRNQPRLVAERRRKYDYSCTMLERAHRNAAVINRFPFVRGVAISGSLSKYSADEAADIDFFIITASRRLWICRSLLHLFKKTTYLRKRQHDFCMNYFLDENELKLKDRNFYTAVESITILPVFGGTALKKFWSANSWVASFFPNVDFDALGRLPAPDIRPLFKRLLEVPFSKSVGHWVNDSLYHLTVNWWRFKFRKSGFPMEHFDSDLRSTRGESKYHPGDYQRSILEGLAKKEVAFLRKSLAPEHLVPERQQEPGQSNKEQQHRWHSDHRGFEDS